MKIPNLKHFRIRKSRSKSFQMQKLSISRSLKLNAFIIEVDPVQMHQISKPQSIVLQKLSNWNTLESKNLQLQISKSSENHLNPLRAKMA